MWHNILQRLAGREQGSKSGVLKDMDISSHLFAFLTNILDLKDKLAGKSPIYLVSLDFYEHNNFSSFICK